MTTHTQMNHVLPPDVVRHLGDLEDIERDEYIVALRDAKWTLSSIGEAAGLSRERVRQIVQKTDGMYDGPIPAPPLKREKKAPVYIEPTPATLARLLELQPLASKVRSSSTKYRAEAEEYAKLLNHAHTVEKVTLYRLAKRLGRSHAGLRAKLVRYGYKESKTGTSRAYKPIKAANRPTA